MLQSACATKQLQDPVHTRKGSTASLSDLASLAGWSSSCHLTREKCQVGLQRTTRQWRMQTRVTTAGQDTESWETAQLLVPVPWTLRFAEPPTF